MSSLEYLESERIKLWEKLLLIEEELKKKTSDYENEAKQSSKKASEFRNRSEEAKKASIEYLEEIKGKVTEIRRNHTLSNGYTSKTEAIQNESLTVLNDIRSKVALIEEQKELIDQHVIDLNELFENYDDFSTKINSLDLIYSKGSDISTKIDTIYKTTLNRKKEIDELYYEIIGYTETDETTGEETDIDGLKKELEDSYTTLKSNFKTTEKEILDFKTNSEKKYEEFVDSKDKSYNQIKSSWEEEYSEIVKKINGLLPNALTAGLSYAYSNKKKDEEAESKRLAKLFYLGIVGMVCVSLIPFYVSIRALIDNVEMAEVILRMPRLVVAILPLYIPVLWVAYSSNKKLNLSKRLIEEYTHKEVLSKTFEGLSTQILNIKDSEISSDLSNRLLYNILEVSSENPGKLISDYNKSDHPLMDALDKSVKLANAVEKLTKIPGLSKLVSVLDKKAKDIVSEVAKEANSGVETLLKRSEASEN